MLIEKLKHKFIELKKEGKSEDSIIIAFKEELQQYILHFIYTHKNYSNLTMYGGTILRIGYGLPRMSEDLDFQTNSKVDLDLFTKDIEKYFQDNYNLKIKTNIRSNSNDRETSVIMIKFDILRDFKFESIAWSALKIRIDINYFKEVDKFIKNTVAGGEGTDLTFTIKTYPLSTLMASKTVAFLLRDSRGIGSIRTNVKPRDVYDMMWYMKERVMPDLEYLKIKGVEVNTFLDFRDKVKIRANKIEDDAFRNDMSQFFFDTNELEGWLSNWRPKFMQLLDSYKVYEVDKLESIYFHIDIRNESRHLIYKFNSRNSDDKLITFEIQIVDSWFRWKDIQINSGHRIKKIESMVENNGNKKLEDIDFEYIGLFYKKIIDYIKRGNNVVYQADFTTKLIRTTSDNLNPKKEICLDKRLLERIQFEELL